MRKANYAPVYLALYPKMAEIFRSHGYALAVHGSLARDFDIVAIPWTAKPSSPEDVVQDLLLTFALKKIGNFEEKAHGRRVITVSISQGECFLDLSFMPTEDRIGIIYPQTNDKILNDLWKKARERWHELSRIRSLEKDKTKNGRNT